MTGPQTPDSRAQRERAVSHYRAGDLLIDVGRQRVVRDDRTIALPKLSFDLLVALARAAPNLVSSEALLRQVWPRAVVGPETLNQRVKLVRDALGDDCRHPRYVEGLRGRGYRLIPAVELRFAPVAEPVSPDDAVSDVVLVPPLAPSVADRPEGPVTGNGAARAAPAEYAAAAAATHGKSSRWRGKGLWLTSLLLALMGGTLLPSPWRRAAPTGAPESVQAFAAHPRSVAVLPFDNLGPVAGDRYLALGLAGAVLHQLASDPLLVVMARSSSFSLGQPTPSAREAGRRLGVRYVVEGSVQHAGRVLRVTAQLIDTRADRELWSAQLDRESDAIFQLQDQISRQVAGELDATVRADASAGHASGRGSSAR